MRLESFTRSRSSFFLCLLLCALLDTLPRCSYPCISICSEAHPPQELRQQAFLTRPAVPSAGLLVVHPAPFLKILHVGKDIMRFGPQGQSYPHLAVAARWSRRRNNGQTKRSCQLPSPVEDSNCQVHLWNKTTVADAVGARRTTATARPS